MNVVTNTNACCCLLRHTDADASSSEVSCKFRRTEPKGQSAGMFGTSADSPNVIPDDHGNSTNNSVGRPGFEDATNNSASASGNMSQQQRSAISKFTAHVKDEDTDHPMADIKSDNDDSSSTRSNQKSTGADAVRRRMSGALLRDDDNNDGESISSSRGGNGGPVGRGPEEEAYTLFYGNGNWYLFLRLHAILCERLYNVYEHAQSLLCDEMLHRNTRRESTATALRMKPKSEISIEDYYPTFIDMLKNLLDGNLETNTFEDSLREMFGIHGYLAFTLDRVCVGSTVLIGWFSIVVIG